MFHSRRALGALTLGLAIAAVCGSALAEPTMHKGSSESRGARATAQTVELAPATAGTVTVEPLAAPRPDSSRAPARLANDVRPAAASVVARPIASTAPQPRAASRSRSRKAPAHKHSDPRPSVTARTARPAATTTSMVPAETAPKASDSSLAPDAATAETSEQSPALEISGVARPDAAVAKPASAASKPAPGSQALFSSSAKRGSGYSLMSALDLALKLVLVLILAYVCMLGLKKFSQRRIAASGKGASLRVMDTIGLAPNRQLHIVALGDRAFLIGSTPDSISLISDVSQVEGMSGPAKGTPSAEPVDPAFSRRLKELMKVAPARQRQDTGVGPRLTQAVQFIKARSNQLRPLGEIIDETLSG